MRPWLLGGTVALCVARPLWPSESAAASGDGLPAVMLWLALGVVWMLGAIGRQQFHIRADWADAAALLLLAWHTLAALIAATRGAPRPAVNMLWEWAGFVLCFFALRQFLVGRRETRAVIAVMTAAAVGVSGYGLYKKYCEVPHTRAYYYAHRDQFFPADAPEQKLLEDRLGEPYPRATFALSNSLAGLLVPWAVIYAAMIFSPHLKRRNKTVAAVPAVPLFVCLALTRSRSALIGAAAGAATMMVAERAASKADNSRPGLLRRWALLVAGLVLLLGAVVGLALTSDAMRRGIAGAAKSLRYRWEYWQATAALIADHPWVGCGPGNFQDYYTRYKLPHAPEEVADPHNFLLEVWATAGTPAALALLVVLGCFAVRVAPMFRPPCASASGPIRPDGVQSAAAVRHVVGGMIAGFALALPLGAMSVAPPGIMPVVIGLPLAIVALASLRPWIKHSPSGQVGSTMDGTAQQGSRFQRAVWPEEARMATIAAAAMLVNLLAAGGIGYPGLALVFWTLLAAGLNAAGAWRVFRLGRSVAVAGLLLALGGMFACYATAYSPVLRSRALLELAAREDAAGRTEAAHKAAEEAAAADPLSSEAPRLAAELALKRWLKEGNPASLMAAQYYVRHVVRLAPHSAAAWSAAGDIYRQIAAAANGQPSAGSEFLLDALSAYQQAVECYPSGAMHRAKLALALHAAGRRDEACQEAECALALDAAQELPEKKLPPRIRRQLEDVR